MQRTRTLTPTLPVLIVVAVLLAMIAFGATRLLMDASADTLAPLDVAGDSAAARPGALDGSKLYAGRVDTVVSIDSTVGDGALHGTGVVVGTDGTIVTASHVVKDYESAAEASMVFVRFNKGDEVKATIVAIDQWNDLAVLRIDPTEVDGLVAAPIVENSNTTMVGAEVAAIGNPFGHEWSWSPGHVTQVHQMVDSQINSGWQVPDAIQFDAAINPGNSGGPLFNARGEVLGIVQQIAGTSKTSSGVAFAIPATIMQRTLLLAKTHRDIPYAWTGIKTRDLSPQIAASNGIAVNRGALVQDATGPAAAAGITVGSPEMFAGQEVFVGDVITKLAGQPIASSEDLSRVSALLTPGAAVDVTVVRGKQTRTTRLTPATAQFAAS